jgi:acyl carrier protein
MSLEDRLREVFENVFQRPVTLDDTVSAADVPEWDSVAHINLMFAIEQEFGVQFPGNRFAEFQNIGELKEYIRQKTA